MAELRVENPKISEQFVAMLEEQGVILPLRLSDEDTGTVLDDDGREVFVVDVNGERSDEEAIEIAQLILLAVNTCGGFRAEVDRG